MGDHGAYRMCCTPPLSVPIVVLVSFGPSVVRYNPSLVRTRKKKVILVVVVFVCCSSGLLVRGCRFERGLYCMLVHILVVQRTNKHHLD